MGRDKEETKARILRAVGKVLAKNGFRQLGINAIAREAGVDKVLIYRYFEGLPSLLEKFGKEGDYWPSFEQLVTGLDADKAGSLQDCATRVLLQLLRELQHRPITQEILRWEILEGNELTRELASTRELTAKKSLNFLENKFGFPPERDITAISAILIAGVVYLALRAKVHTQFLGIDFDSESGWERIERAVTYMIEETFECSK